MCCKDCYTPKRRARPTADGTTDDKYNSMNRPGPCNAVCAIWTPCYYLAIACLAAGISLIAIGATAVNFFNLAEDGYVEEECLLIKNESVWSSNDGRREYVGCYYYYMIVPFTGEKDPVYELNENLMSLADSDWRTDAINKTYLWGGSDEDGGRIYRGDVLAGAGWLATEGCWREPGEIHDEMSIIWSPKKAIDSGHFQGITLLGAIFVAVGAAALLTLPFLAPRAYPLCMDWAVPMNFAVTALLLFLGSLPACIIMFVAGGEQFGPYFKQSGAQAAGTITAILCVLLPCAMIPACLLSCKRMVQHHGTDRAPLVVEPEATTNPV